MKLEEFKYYNNPKYIESCSKIIEYGNCKNIQFCTECPFHWYNLNKEFADCTEYGESTDCLIKDDKLVESAEEFLKIVEFENVIENSIKDCNYLIRPMSDEEFSTSQSEFVSTLQEALRKEEEYIIVDQNSCICSEVNTLRLAEEFVRNSLQKDSDNTFTIYKKIKVGTAKVNVETEWSE